MKFISLILLLVLVSCGSKKDSNGNEVEGLEEVIMKPLDGRPPVLIVGDSISIGYYNYVQTLLPGVQIIHNTGNAANTTKGVADIQTWLAHSPRWEVCTFNFGLHDLRTAFTSVSVDDYKDNLKFIGEQMQLVCDKLMFINTTHVPANSSYRPFGSEVIYNAAAEEVMTDLNIPVCDLHTKSVQIANLHKRPDNVHYIASGSKILAQTVVDCISNL